MWVRWLKGGICFGIQIFYSLGAFWWVWCTFTNVRVLHSRENIFSSFQAETFPPLLSSCWGELWRARAWNAAWATTTTSTSASASTSTSASSSRLVSSARLPFQGCYKRNFLGAKKSWKSNLILFFVKFEVFSHSKLFLPSHKKKKSSFWFLNPIGIFYYRSFFHEICLHKNCSVIVSCGFLQEMPSNKKV